MKRSIYIKYTTENTKDIMSIPKLVVTFGFVNFKLHDVKEC